MNIFRRSIVLCGLVSALALGACQVPPAGNAGGTSQPSPASSAQPAATPATNAAVDDRNVNNVPVTLPVIDYLFQSDESFVADLKSRLSLNDEQINKLQEAARTETANLNEDGEGEYSGSTRAAVKLTNDRLSEILGADKANEFARFTRSRLSGEEGGNASGNTMNASAPNTGDMRPNSVPTDTRVVVNAPAFRMDVFDAGKLVKSYRVGIGYPEFPLPVGLRKAETLIFNPTWTPPDEPWVKGKVQPGQKVAAGSKLNPLGPVKIPIGSPSLIHGGKQPTRLGNFASHGCVGLTNDGVIEVSRLLAQITGTELSDEQLKEIQADKSETKNIKLSSAVPVELRYETIVVEDGKLKIYRDVYDRDTNTEENLRRTLEAHGVSFDSLSGQEKTYILEALRQMSRDAQGNLDGEANANANGNTNANTNSNANANSNSNSGQVTRNIKGQKEIVIELAQLAGKGYPAPIAMQMPAQETAAPKTSGNRRRG